MVKIQGEDAHCVAWIYTAEDCMDHDENDETTYPCENNPELAERIFNQVGNIDYILSDNSRGVDETTERQLMLIQQRWFISNLTGVAHHKGTTTLNLYTDISSNKAMNSITGTLTNPSNPSDIREVTFTKVWWMAR